MALMRVADLTIKIENRLLCEKLDLKFQPGEVWGILGRNGSGKTTLLHTLAGLRKSFCGQIYLKERLLSKLTKKNIARELAILFQHYEDTFPSNVLETVSIGRYPHNSSWNIENQQDRAIVDNALKTMSLQNMKKRQINTLSGGERRRLAIATVLSQTPSFYLLDEPTNHLDIKYQQKVLSHFRELAINKKKLVVMALHDINQAARFCDKILMIFDDGICEHGPTKEFLSSSRLERLYQHPLNEVAPNFWLAT